MLQLLMLFHILKHPVTADVVLVTPSYAEEASMVADNSAAKLGDVVLEVDQVLALLVCGDVVEVDVFVTPLEVVNDSLVRQLFLHDECVLKEVDDALFDVEVIELSDHCFLVLEVPLVLVDQGVALVDYVSNIVKDCAVRAVVQLG